MDNIIEKLEMLDGKILDAIILLSDIHLTYNEMENISISDKENIYQTQDLLDELSRKIRRNIDYVKRHQV